MNKDAFWKIIEYAKKESNGDRKLYTWYIDDSLRFLKQEKILEFQIIFRSYLDIAYKYGLWTAAMIMHGGCTDDEFTDFRCWLISQGEEVYFNALKNPDSLAELPITRDCQFEALISVACGIYECLTGKHPYEDMSQQHFDETEAKLREDVEYDEGIDYPYRWHEAVTYLPELCNKYLNYEEIGRAVMNQNDPWSSYSCIVESRKFYKPLNRKEI